MYMLIYIRWGFVWEKALDFSMFDQASSSFIGDHALDISRAQWFSRHYSAHHHGTNTTCAMMSQKAQPFQHFFKHAFDEGNHPRLSMLKLTPPWHT